MKYTIAGQTIEFQWGAHRCAEVFERELRYYPQSDALSDCIVRLVDSLPQAVSANPSSYLETADGFGIRGQRFQAAWHESTDPLTVDFCFPDDRNSWRHKLLGMQFTHPYEEISQVFHESVLVPTLLMFFSQKAAVIHGSAVQNPHTGEAVIFGGSGGIGKTSSEIALILDHGFRFLADDLSFVDAQGIVWPNYAFPKIYAYNVQNSPEVYRRLFQQRGLLDRFWWQVTKRRGLETVRRRADLNTFFGAERVGTGAKLGQLNVLFRRQTDQVRAVNITARQAAEMNLAVIQGEYKNLVTSLHWQAFNRAVLGEKPPLNTVMTESLYATLLHAFEPVNCRVIEIPFHFSITQLRQQLIPLLLE